MAIDPTGRALKEFVQENPDEPFVMLNLLRFRPSGGRQRYLEYLRASAPFVERHGGVVLHDGFGFPPIVAEEGQAWDAIVCVRYPSRRAFSDMVRDADYQATTHLRAEALVEAVLQPTSVAVATE